MCIRDRPDGPVVDALMDAGLEVVVVSSRAVKGLRTRYGLAGNKDDRSDAFMLADCLRTDGHRWASLQPDQPQTLALRAAVRTRKDLVATRIATDVYKRQAKELLEELYLAGGDPAAVVEERGLGQVSDQAELERLVDAVLAENPAAVADFQGGKEQALQRLVGGVMKATRGRADARVVTGLLRDRLAP